MSEKSHVALEYKICRVTGKKYATDSSLLDKRMRNTLERETVTGWGISPKVQEKLDDDYCAFIGINYSDNQILSEEESNNPERTGEIIYLKEHVAKEIFDNKVQKINYMTLEISEFLKGLNKEH